MCTEAKFLCKEGGILGRMHRLGAHQTLSMRRTSRLPILLIEMQCLLESGPSIRNIAGARITQQEEVSSEIICSVLVIWCIALLRLLDERAEELISLIRQKERL